MKSTLCIDDLEFPLGQDALMAVLMEMTNGEYCESYRGKPWNTLMGKLAEHPDPHWRAHLANVVGLPMAIARKLADDEDLLVIMALLESGRCLSWISPQQVMRYLALPNTNLHLALVLSLNDFSNLNQGAIAWELLNSPATVVRKALAENFHVPREILNALAADDDADVRLAASNTIAQQEVADDWEENEEA